MLLLNIKSIPNQIFNFTNNDITYTVELRTIQGLVYMSVKTNGETLFNSQLCVPNAFINPYNYLSDNGKFYFKCLDNEYPNFTKFGSTQSLLFYEKDDLNA